MATHRRFEEEFHCMRASPSVLGARPCGGGTVGSGCRSATLAMLIHVPRLWKELPGTH